MYGNQFVGRKGKELLIIIHLQLLQSEGLRDLTMLRMKRDFIALFLMGVSIGASISGRFLLRLKQREKNHVLTVVMH